MLLLLLQVPVLLSSVLLVSTTAKVLVSRSLISRTNVVFFVFVCCCCPCKCSHYVLSANCTACLRCQCSFSWKLSIERPGVVDGSVNLLYSVHGTLMPNDMLDRTSNPEMPAAMFWSLCSLLLKGARH